MARFGAILTLIHARAYTFKCVLCRCLQAEIVVASDGNDEVGEFSTPAVGAPLNNPTANAMVMIASSGVGWCLGGKM
jgi:hypothetical protein